MQNIANEESQGVELEKLICSSAGDTSNAVPYKIVRFPLESAKMWYKHLSKPVHARQNPEVLLDNIELIDNLPVGVRRQHAHAIIFFV